MSNTTLNLTAKQIVSVRGLLDHNHATELFSRGQALIAEYPSLKFDLSQVERTDSAGLALLLAWLKEAARVKHAISFVKPPLQIINLAALTGLTPILGFDNNKQS